MPGTQWLSLPQMTSRPGREPGNEPLLLAPQRGTCSSLTLRMIVAEHVQCPMHDAPRELFPHGDAKTARGGARLIGRDVHVTEYRCVLPGSTKPERDHVGRGVATQVAPVQRADLPARHEG